MFEDMDEYSDVSMSNSLDELDLSSSKESIENEKLKQILYQYARDFRVKERRKLNSSFTRNLSKGNSRLAKSVRQALEPKKKKLRHRQIAVDEYYTDILSHNFDPYDGRRLAIGTTQGMLNIVNYFDNTAAPTMEQRITTPNNRSITNLDWASIGIYLVSSTSCWLHKSTSSNNDDNNDFNESNGIIDPNPCLELTTATDILKVCALYNNYNNLQSEKVGLVCQNGKTRIYDINTEKLVNVLSDHKSNVTDCKANENYIATGGIDGNVFVYDGKLRTTRPIKKFQHNNPIIALSLSGSGENTVAGGGARGNSGNGGEFIGVALQDKNTPTLYNLRTGFPLGGITMVDKLDVKAIAMDDYGGVYWGGNNGILYYSEDFTTIQRKLPAIYSEKKIRCIKSITLPSTRTKSNKSSTTIKPYISIAGDSNSVLISNNGCNYWAYMIHMINDDLDLTLSTTEQEQDEIL